MIKAEYLQKGESLDYTNAAVEMGQAVYFDGDGITDAAGEIAAGYATAPADANAETVLVKLCG